MTRITLTALSLLMASTAQAQMVCGEHSSIEKRLETGYQEARTAIGLAANGGLIELYTSEKGTFTIVLTHPNGMACLMAVGENWEQVKGPVGTPAHHGISSPLSRGNDLPPL